MSFACDSRIRSARVTESGVASPAVVEDLDVLEDLATELGLGQPGEAVDQLLPPRWHDDELHRAGSPVLRFSSSVCMRAQKDSIIPMSYASPIRPVESAMEFPGSMDTRASRPFFGRRLCWMQSTFASLCQAPFSTSENAIRTITVG